MINAEFVYALNFLFLSMVAGIPLLVAFLFCFVSLRSTAIRLFCFSSLPALVGVFIIPVDVNVEVPWFFMGGRMGLDPIGRVFLCVSAFIWLLSSWSVRKRFDSAEQFPRFYVFFLVSMAGNFGLILAQDMLGFYLFFALMSLATYGLVVQDGSAGSRKAGIIYLVWVMISEVALFVALVIVAGRSGSLVFAEAARSSVGFGVVIFLYISFGMKIGAFPLHGWMPPAYQATPAPAAAAMAGAMVNAGLLGFLRFLPLGVTVFPQAGIFFITGGLVSTFYGLVMGLGRKKAGQVLAYSSMSQMGLMTIIFGLGLFSVEAGQFAIPVLIVFALHHALAKSSLFFGYDYVSGRSKSSFPLLAFAGLLLLSLALAGFPLTSGAIAKTGFKDLTVLVGEPWYGVGIIFFPLSSIGTTLLMVYFVDLVLSGQKGKVSALPGLKWIWVMSLVAVVGVIWFMPEARAQAVRSLDAGKLWQSLWPVAVGCFVFFLWKRGCRAKIISPFSLWDVFVAEEKVGADRVDDFIQKLVGGFAGLNVLKQKQSAHGHLVLTRVKIHLRKFEKVLGRWIVVGFSFVLICLLLFFL